MPSTVAALVAEVRGGQMVPAGKESGAAGGGAERKASLFDDADLMLTALTDEIEAGAVVVTVHVGESRACGSEGNNSASRASSS